jgi:hypothetical protein
VPALLKRLKGLEKDLAMFQAETCPSWAQAGQVFKVLLAEAKTNCPDDPVVKAIEPVTEMRRSPASGVLEAPRCATDAGSMRIAVNQMVLSAGGARGTTG